MGIDYADGNTVLREVHRMLQDGRRFLFSAHSRNRKLGETHEAWSIQNCSAHDFGIVVMYTSLTEQVRQLQDAGFTVEQVLSSETGQAVQDEDSARSACWLHYVARKQKTPLSFG